VAPYCRIDVRLAHVDVFPQRVFSSIRGFEDFVLQGSVWGSLEREGVIGLGYGLGYGYGEMIMWSKSKHINIEERGRCLIELGLLGFLPGFWELVHGIGE